MFSQQAVIEKNRIHHSLLGAALMNSDALLFRGNRIEEIRNGSTPYGVLLKDIGDLRLVENEFVRNRVAIYADGTPDSPEHQALIQKNLIVGNEAAFTLQNSVRLIVTENSIIDNVSDVVSEGGTLSAENQWSLNGRGNFWSEYRGFDRNGDGLGELPFRVEASFDYLLQRNPNIRAFMFTPVHRALEFAARMFPLFHADPLVVDPAPLMHPVAIAKEWS
jgi:nitrous oxidase accessory protein